MGNSPTDSRKREAKELTDLPAGLIRKPADLHAVRSATGPWRGVPLRIIATAAAALLTMTIASGKLDCQALAHEVGSIFDIVISLGSGGVVADISGILRGSSTYGKLE